jgi:nucleotide-binding universal stress UspA family protein
MRLLIATDGSRGAENAIRFVWRTPLSAPVEATVVTVCPELPRPLRERLEKHREADHLLRDFENRQFEQARRRTVRAEQLLAKTGWRIASRVREGHPSERLLHSAREGGSELLVVGVRGHNRHGGFLLGSVPKRLLRLAPCPVLIVKPDAGRALGATPGASFDILLAFDGSEHARRAVQFVKRLPVTGTGRVRVLRIIPTPAKRFEDPKFEEIMGTVAAEETVEAKAEANGVRESLEGAGHRVAIEVRPGNPFKEIMAEVERDKPDLLVTGHMGVGGVEDFQIGSLANRLAHYAPCSVLVVRPTLTGSKPSGPR